MSDPEDSILLNPDSGDSVLLFSQTEEARNAIKLFQLIDEFTYVLSLSHGTFERAIKNKLVDERTSITWGQNLTDAFQPLVNLYGIEFLKAAPNVLEWASLFWKLHSEFSKNQGRSLESIRSDSKLMEVLRISKIMAMLVVFKMVTGKLIGHMIKYATLLVAANSYTGLLEKVTEKLISQKSLKKFFKSALLIASVISAIELAFDIADSKTHAEALINLSSYFLTSLNIVIIVSGMSLVPAFLVSAYFGLIIFLSTTIYFLYEEHKSKKVLEKVNHAFIFLDKQKNDLKQLLEQYVIATAIEKNIRGPVINRVDKGIPAAKKEIVKELRDVLAASIFQNLNRCGNSPGTLSYIEYLFEQRLEIIRIHLKLPQGYDFKNLNDEQSFYIAKEFYEEIKGLDSFVLNVYNKSMDNYHLDNKKKVKCP